MDKPIVGNITFGPRTPVGAGDGNTFVVNEQHYVTQIADLTARLAEAERERDEARHHADMLGLLMGKELPEHGSMKDGDLMPRSLGLVCRIFEESFNATEGAKNYLSFGWDGGESHKFTVLIQRDGAMTPVDVAASEKQARKSAEARLTALREAVIPHVSDLRKTAAALVEIPGFLLSAGEIALAADELQAALAKSAAK